ncbi:hypothetical protein ACH4UM_31710 [Streptomyces sp. NPDC020801]|uniref:hypothetical protein n=1 Tax=Streptomyces sp. NPDC020801 TaxID=3365093 RepID=UPI0037B7BF7A
MSQVRTGLSDLPQPLRAVTSALRHLPGAPLLGKAVGGALDRIGSISPRGRRMAIYTGAGVLGVAGVVEWPVALTGAAVAWLTQAHPGQSVQEEMPQDSPRLAAAGPGPAIAPAGAQGGREVRPADAEWERYGAGDRLEPSHFRHEPPRHHVHEQPAKVGDPATSSALKQVAEASAHHDEPGPSSEHPSGGRAHQHEHHRRPTDGHRHSG